MLNQQSGHNKSINQNLHATGYLEIQPIKNLVYRGQLNYYQGYIYLACIPPCI